MRHLGLEYLSPTRGISHNNIEKNMIYGNVKEKGQQRYKDIAKQKLNGS
jgi:hypothetical protein